MTGPGNKPPRDPITNGGLPDTKGLGQSRLTSKLADDPLDGGVGSAHVPKYIGPTYFVNRKIQLYGEPLPRYTVTMGMGDRIRQARKKADFTQAKLAEAVGVTQATVSDWERDVQNPERSRVRIIARVTGVTVEWIELGLISQNDTDRPTPRLGRVKIIGRVQAGVWVEALELPFDEQEYVETPADSRFPGAHRFGLRVSGPSMNLVFADGSVVVCVRFEDIETPPTSGNYVVVHRRRASGLVEATVKQFIDDATGVWLWPRSTHPAHQQPISLADKHDEEVIITALVVGAYQPF